METKELVVVLEKYGSYLDTQVKEFEGKIAGGELGAEGDAKAGDEAEELDIRLHEVQNVVGRISKGEYEFSYEDNETIRSAFAHYVPPDEVVAKAASQINEISRRKGEEKPEFLEEGIEPGGGYRVKSLSIEEQKKWKELLGTTGNYAVVLGAELVGAEKDSPYAFYGSHKLAQEAIDNNEIEFSVESNKEEKGVTLFTGPGEAWEAQGDYGSFGSFATEREAWRMVLEVQRQDIASQATFILMEKLRAAMGIEEDSKADQKLRGDIELGTSQPGVERYFED